ncbi:MAG: hypothetical protein E7012_06250 [Alphaproteobacteria bacterium]|nr:hypothetical protein [Alphaproteobacteria bacterium]
MINHKFAILALTSTLVLNAAIANAAGKNGVAAVVNGQNITVAEIKEAYELAPGAKDKVSFEEFYTKTLDDFVANELVYQTAVAAKVTDTPEYKAQLKTMKKGLASKVYLEKEVDKMLTDDKLKKVYNDYKNNFKAEKEVKAKHILVDNEDKAKEVIKKLNNKGNFDKLAKEYSKEPAELGYFTKEVMVPEFAEAAFDLKKGQFTKEPVKTQFGYHVILVEDIRDAKPLTFDKAKEQIKGVVAQSALGKVLDNISSKASVVRYDFKGKEIANQ